MDGQGTKQHPSTNTLCAQIAASIMLKTWHGLPPCELILHNLRSHTSEQYSANTKSYSQQRLQMSETHNADTQSYSHQCLLISEQYIAETHTYPHLCSPISEPCANHFLGKKIITKTLKYKIGNQYLCLLTSEASWVASLPRVCRARRVLREEIRSRSQASPGIHLHHHPICTPTPYIFNQPNKRAYKATSSISQTNAHTRLYLSNWVFAYRHLYDIV